MKPLPDAIAGQQLTRRNSTRRDFLFASTLTSIGIASGNLCNSWLPNCHASTTGAEPFPKVARATQGAVATVHPLATQAAADILAQGGNAIDGAIAAALMLGVADGHNSGLGGGCLGLVRTAAGQVHAIDGREKAPAAASRDMYLRNGKIDGKLSFTGALASAVPSQLAALAHMHRHWGKLPWRNLFQAPIEVAKQGFSVNRSTHRTILEQAQNIALFPATRTVLLDANGKAPAIGSTLIQTDLAKSLEMIAAHGVDWFYENGFAKACCDYLQSLGGILTIEDFRNYNIVERKVLETRYRGHRILGFPPPSSGGIHIAQMLHMLEKFPVKEIADRSQADYFHLLAECMTRAFADRAYWLGDSDFVSVPNGLLDPSYALKRIEDFDWKHAAKNIDHGTPHDAKLESTAPASNAHEDAKHTTHLTVADTDGNWVALTNTVNTSWGSKVMIPGTGIVMNNQMDDFSIAPGTPNAFGLVGSHANAIAPGKRPLSSMSPTIVLNADGEPILTCGAAGGPKIINATFQTIVRVLDLGETVQQAIAAPRIHHQWTPNVLNYEGTDEVSATPRPRTVDSAIVAELHRRGHEIKHALTIGIAQGIQRQNGKWIAAHDPRAEGASIS